MAFQKRRCEKGHRLCSWILFEACKMHRPLCHAGTSRNGKGHWFYSLYVLKHMGTCSTLVMIKKKIKAERNSTYLIKKYNVSLKQHHFYFFLSNLVIMGIIIPWADSSEYQTSLCGVFDITILSLTGCKAETPHTHVSLFSGSAQQMEFYVMRH